MKYALALSLLPLFACSKGGTTDPMNQTCRSVADSEPDMGPTSGALPKALYAELKEAGSGTVLPITLDGVGGAYSGQSRPLGKCDAPGTYYVERLVLVDAAGGAVATAVRSSSSYIITYANGSTTSVSGSSFSRYYASYSAAAGTSAPTLSSLTGGGMTRQGDKLTVSFAAMAGADDCGIRDSLWYLSPATSPGSQASPASQVLLTGDSGSGSLRVHPDLLAGTYYLEGRITTKTGRVFQVRRINTTDTTYSLYNTTTGTTATSLPLARVDVSVNPSADRTAPTAVSMEATPAKVIRCQQVSLSLKLMDDFGLPPSQQVPVYVGPLSQPNLLRMMLSGGSTVGGTFVVPKDAPGGIWVSYPETVQDAAGNIGAGNLSADKFTIGGSGTPVSAATFVVQVDSTPVPDLGGTTPDLREPAADLRTPEAQAVLTNISVDTPTVTADMPVKVTITWTGMGLR